MTFEIPEEVAERFESEVPFLVAKLLQPRVSPEMTLTSEQWEEATMAANEDPELNELMNDWQAAADPIEEPWDEPAAR